ncbi:MAG TPA: OpgC domain-containing protein [Bradyrhizobium sp.]
MSNEPAECRDVEASAMNRADETIDRDLRLDVCRGIALWFIFLDHIPDNVCSWLTMRHYGFSDATEVFMFVSGVTCALAYGRIQRCDGWWSVVGHTLRRGWEIHMAFLSLIVALVVMVYMAGESRWADVTNTRVLLQHPGAALARATVLQYRPVNTDVLPTFVLFHLLFAPLLWLLLKAPNVAIAASALLYGLVQLYGWNLPGWPINEWYFNPFAWQFLVVLGAWWVVAGRKRFRPVLISRPFVGLAVIYLLFALVIALSWSLLPLQALVPPFVAKAIYPIDKTDLDPLRLFHFLAIAILVARLVPSDWPGLMSLVLRGAIRCGENSLEIYCLGVMLSLAAHMLLSHFSGGIAAQIVVSTAGVMMLVAFATLSTWIRIASRRQPELM